MNLIEILGKPEGKTLEFKRDASSHVGIVKTLIAFANTAGGTLVIGVEDKTYNITGVNDPLNLEEKITNLINDSIEPLILPEIEILSYKKNQIVIVQVYPSSIRPHYLKSIGLEKGTYVRVGSSNRLADKALIEEMKRFASNESYDEQPILKLSKEAIDFDVISESFASIRKLKPQDLETLRIVVKHQGKLVPTVAGILLFGKKRGDYFPDAWIQAGRFFGTDKSRILDSTEIHSYPMLAIEQAWEFVKKHATMSLEISAVKRTEHWNIPLQSVREAIINAVAHTDYSQSGAPIRLAIFQDRLEIENPGLLAFGLTIEEISQGVSKLRNRVIGRILNELKLIEQWGSGIQRMIAECKGSGLEPPKFEEIGTHFRVTIYIQPRLEPVLDKISTNILNLLKNTGGLSTQDIAEKIKLTPRATRTRLASLVERGMIVQVGSGPHDPTKQFILKGNSMLIDNTELEDYKNAINKYGYSEHDFELYENNETIEKEHAIFPMLGKVTIKNIRTGKQKIYRAGSGSSWPAEFELDLQQEFFE